MASGGDRKGIMQSSANVSEHVDKADTVSTDTVHVAESETKSDKKKKKKSKSHKKRALQSSNKTSGSDSNSYHGERSSVAEDPQPSRKTSRLSWKDMGKKGAGKTQGQKRSKSCGSTRHDSGDRMSTKQDTCPRVVNRLRDSH